MDWTGVFVMAGSVVLMSVAVLFGGGNLMPARKSADHGHDDHHDEKQAPQSAGEQAGLVVLVAVLAVIVSLCFMVLGNPHA